MVFCQSFQALSMGGIALLLPLIRQDLDLTFTQGGTLSAATTLVYMIMQIPAGYLADRYSPKRLFTIGILGSTALSITLGLVTNYWQALANQVLSGFFRSLIFIPGMVLLTGWFPHNRRATVTGLYVVGPAVGNVFFNLVGPLLVARWDWRFAFISVASVGIFVALFLWRYGKDSPAMAARQKGSMFGAFKFFRYKIMWVCGVIQFIRLALVYGITFWLPSLLVNEKGFSLETAGIIMAVQSVLMVPSNVLGGYISDRLKNPPLVIGVSLGALGITTVLLINVASPALVVALIFINALFLQMYFGPLFTIPVEVLGESKAGVAAGFSNFFANIGGFSSTFLMGVIKDATGAFKPGFLAIGGACLVGVILTLVLAKIRRSAIIAAKSG